MDAGGTGALIGVGFIVLFGICFKVYDVYHQHKTTENTILTSSPLLVRRHSKINTLLPK